MLRKHNCFNVGAMEAEESRCAALIDGRPNVEYWVRNLTSGAIAFRLPLADRGFYPDFAAKLKDGRVAVVEYKGEGYRTNDDSREKAMVGEMWAKRRGDGCLFAMVGRDDVEARLGRMSGATGGRSRRREVASYPSGCP